MKALSPGKRTIALQAGNPEGKTSAVELSAEKIEEGIRTGFNGALSKST